MRYTICWGCLSEGVWLEGIFNSRMEAEMYLDRIDKKTDYWEILEIA